jgi:ribosomal protein S27AE
MLTDCGEDVCAEDQPGDRHGDGNGDEDDGDGYYDDDDDELEAPRGRCTSCGVPLSRTEAAHPDDMTRGQCDPCSRGR